MSEGRLKCFVSYSHEDKKMCDKFLKYISCLERFIDTEHWYDGKITAGENIDDEIKKQLESSDVVFILISPSYIKSYYCYEKELKRAIERQKQGACKVVPVILRKYPSGEYIFSKLKFVPTDGKPVADFKNQNDGFVDAFQGIKNLLEELNLVKRNKKTTKPINKKQGQKHSGKGKMENSKIQFKLVKKGKVVHVNLTSDVFDRLTIYGSALTRFIVEMNNLSRESLARFKEEASKSAPHKNKRYQRNDEVP